MHTPAASRAFSFTRTRLCCALLPLGMATLLIGPLAIPLPAQAQAPAVRTYAIAAGPLDDALNRYARETGILLSYGSDLTEGKTSAGLHRSYGVGAGLEALLAGSGLTATRQTNGSYVLERLAGAGIATLAPVRVEGGSLGSTTEHTGSYTTGNLNTATRLTLSPRETPQSVSVLTRQQMDDQGFQSIEDIANVTTGLTIARGAPERAQLRARGFSIGTYMVDGVPMSIESDTYGFSTLALYDRIEVLRGAAGLLVGTGDPSGVINLVRKRPTRENQVSLKASVGRWQDYRTEVDASGPLNEAGTLRGRAVAAYQHTDTYIDHYRHDRRLVYGTLEADVGENTTVSVGLSHNSEHSPGSAWYGLPTYADGSFMPLDRSANMTPEWAFWDKKNTRVFADIEHRLAHDWKARLSAYSMKSDLDSIVTSLSRVAGTELLAIGYGGTSVYWEKQHAFDASVAGPVTAFGRRHEVVVGATHRRQAQFFSGAAQAGYRYVFDPLQWQNINAPEPVIGAPWEQYDVQRQTGVHAAARLSITDPLTVILGSRVDWYDMQAVTSGGGYKANRKVTPYAGVVYDLNDTYSVYGSWTGIFKPQNYRSASGDLLDPLKGTNMEVGIKGEFLGGALNTSAALYKINQENLPMSLALDTCAPGLRACYAAAGEVESKGVELEAAGELTRNWQLSAGYTFGSAKHKTDSMSATAGTRYATTQPRHLFKVSTTYRLPGAWQDWKVGGSVRVQNEIYNVTNGVTVRQGGVAVVDLMAAWQFDRHLDFRFNLYNAFDRHYYQSVSTPISGNGFGTPRSFLVSARYQF
jgi:outer membrane receptor for ferric coprogen and ferric-rhodotorulic acid